jgi:hypothetical protein
MPAHAFIAGDFVISGISEQVRTKNTALAPCWPTCSSFLLYAGSPQSCLNYSFATDDYSRCLQYIA